MKAKNELRAVYDSLPESEKESLGKPTKKVHALAVSDENKSTHLDPENDLNPTKVSYNVEYVPYGIDDQHIVPDTYRCYILSQ